MRFVAVFFIGFLLIQMLVGCAGLDVALDVADVLLSDPTVHAGTVSEVEMSADKTTVHFDDGFTYELDGAHYVKPGTERRIIKSDDGYDLN